MKIAIALFRIDRPTGQPQDFDIPEPGKILGASVVFEKAPVILRGQHPNDVIPVDVLVVQVDPDAPKRRRRFHLLGPRGFIAPADGSVAPDPRFITLINSPQFGPVVVFEEAIAAEELAAIAAAQAEAATPPPDDRPPPVSGEIDPEKTIQIVTP